MKTFSPSVIDYWRARFGGRTIAAGGELSVTVDDTLSVKCAAMILELADGSRYAAVRPGLADRIALRVSAGVTTARLRRELADAGVALHNPDFLFYWPADAACDAVADAGCVVRRLTAADSAAFVAFQAQASEQDREDAWVALDHWAVFGCFVGGRLVSAASLFAWPESMIVDLGVLTLHDARGRGHGRAVVRAISRFARQQGREPQYRCQTDNHASVALARACGMVVFGTWEVASDDAARDG